MKLNKLCILRIEQNEFTFMNSENDPYRLLLNLSDKINWKESEEYVPLSNLSIYYAWKNIKKSYKSNKFKVSHPTLNEYFGLPNGSPSALDVQDYYIYIYIYT